VVKPGEIRIKDYTYELPLEKIAQHPLKNRDESRLLIYNNESISEDVFKNIAGFLPEDSLLIFNDTKVINARLLFETETGKQVEIFCLEPADENERDLQLAFAKTGKVLWKCIVGNLKAWKSGLLEKRSGDFILTAELAEKSGDAFLIKFKWEPETLSFGEVLLKTGMTPLPPYMKRNPTEEDKTRYQTVYADTEGSVAAPTAGLHFTKEVLNTLQNKKIKCDYITLHVGAGTFKPVKSAEISGHEMHSERFYVEKKTVEDILGNLNGSITAVGTTSLRTIESLYWFGSQLIYNKTLPDNVIIEQWQPYENPANITANEAIQAVLEYINNTGKDYIEGKTNIIIVPGYEFKIINALITNFHQPQSTLLLLIAAFAGTGWKQAYEYALNNGFRFLSYGDSSLLYRDKKL
jgi:S-adenosylmethionine:tRNA ribosyltransferase-isomerase